MENLSEAYGFIRRALPNELIVGEEGYVYVTLKRSPYGTFVIRQISARRRGLVKSLNAEIVYLVNTNSRSISFFASVASAAGYLEFEVTLLCQVIDASQAVAHHDPVREVVADIEDLMRQEWRAYDGDFRRFNAAIERQSYTVTNNYGLQVTIASAELTSVRERLQKEKREDQLEVERTILEQLLRHGRINIEFSAMMHDDWWVPTTERFVKLKQLVDQLPLHFIDSVGRGKTAILPQLPPPESPAPLRLETAAPAETYLSMPFDLAAAVLPDIAPPLAEEGLEKVKAAKAHVEWSDTEAYITLLLRMQAPTCDILGPTEYTFRLYKNEASQTFYFQLSPKYPGAFTVLVELFQQEIRLSGVRVTTIAGESRLAARQAITFVSQPIEELKPTELVRASAPVLPLGESEKAAHELYDTYNRRLHLLEKQKASLGLTADPAIVMQIEDIYREMAGLQQRYPSIT